MTTAQTKRNGNGTRFKWLVGTLTTLILAWMGWQSIESLKGPRFTAHDARRLESKIDSLKTSLNGAMIDLDRRILRQESFHVGDSPHPTALTQAQIDANTEGLRMIGDEMRRIQEGQSKLAGRVEYLILSLDDLKKKFE